MKQGKDPGGLGRAVLCPHQGSSRNPESGDAARENNGYGQRDRGRQTHLKDMRRYVGAEYCNYISNELMYF